MEDYIEEREKAAADVVLGTLNPSKGRRYKPPPMRQGRSDWDPHDW